MTGARPAGPGELDAGSGAERRLSGGIGAKRVDVSWTTEESGLIFGLSIKSINFRDGSTTNFQKNLVNRRGDMLIEAVTLHRRFPYAVLGGLLFLDKDAEHDDTDQRRSTFDNAFPRLRMFTGRSDPTGRDEQYERLYIVLVDANPFSPSVRCFRVDQNRRETTLGELLDDMVELVLERNPDFYEPTPDGGIQHVKQRRRRLKGKKVPVSPTSQPEGTPTQAADDTAHGDTGNSDDADDEDIPEVGDPDDEYDDTDPDEGIR